MGELSLGELILRGARHAAWRLTPPRLEHWREDLAQDVALYVAWRHSLGHNTNAQCYQWALQHAVRRLLFLIRGQAELATDFEPVGEWPSDLQSFAAWRLQRVWGDLTDLQREGVRVLLVGDSPVQAARDMGVCSSALFRAVRTALERMDNPAEFTRGREYQRVATKQRKPIDPAKVAAKKAREATQARERRARNLRQAS